ncbi:flippase-like domain-containing protein [Labilithrix luteola]|uniref:flippase-like domain-containing protein n=1 Tax=Labilithrix luteola TaxID=1391654 RepID=UPI0014755E02|nr:flippase-like domain-containing protein [Labilithrix luteola]
MNARSDGLSGAAPPPSTTEGEPRKGAILRWLRIAGFLACLALFAHALAKSDLAAAWARIREIGPVVLLVLVPFPFAIASDTWAWQRLLHALDRTPPLRRLFRVRLATEAVTNSAPAGAIWAEALAPVLVSVSTGTPVSDVFAASTAKRWLVVRIHGIYVALAATFGAAAILHASEHLLGSHALLPIVYVSAGVLFLSSFGIEAVAARGQIAGKVSRWLGRRRFASVQKWIEERHHHFAAADVQLARLSSDRRATLVASARVAMLWFFEGLETYLILHLLGAPLSLVEVMSFDAALSIVRSAAFFAPAGIGVQDVGYLAVLEAYGVPNAHTIGPAFVVLKRMKEAVFITLGFAMLATFKKRTAK